ncbi:MAG: type II toxin-antitoxin system VapC family toxin [Myxococcales bacterium]
MWTLECNPFVRGGTSVADLYLDACCFIYLVEGAPRWRRPLQQRIQSLPDDARVLTSQLTRLECRSKPLRDNDQTVLALYDSLFSAGRVKLIDIGAPIIDRATLLRAAYNLKTPDALHVASAIMSGASVFLTGDSAIARCADIKVEIIVPDDQ